MPAAEIFVFGSNLAGRHGKGAAKEAYEKHGARYWCGHGHHGNSYAIPTKDQRLRTLPLMDIRRFVDEFLDYAKKLPSRTFRLTPIGCGLAGYSPTDIAPMFRDAPPNVILPEEFRRVLVVPDIPSAPDDISATA